MYALDVGVLHPERQYQLAPRCSKVVVGPARRTDLRQVVLAQGLAQRIFGRRSSSLADPDQVAETGGDKHVEREREVPLPRPEAATEAERGRHDRVYDEQLGRQLRGEPGDEEARNGKDHAGDGSNRIQHEDQADTGSDQERMGHGSQCANARAAPPITYR